MIRASTWEPKISPTLALVAVSAGGFAPRSRNFGTDASFSNGFLTLRKGQFHMTGAHMYAVRPRKDRRGFDLISNALPFRAALVWRAKRNQQCNQLRKVFQPFT